MAIVSPTEPCGMEYSDCRNVVLNEQWGVVKLINKRRLIKRAVVLLPHEKKEKNMQTNPMVDVDQCCVERWGSP